MLEVLKLRLLMAKTSVKKYEAIRRSVCADGRVHGLLQFYGANRTGRWAGRLVQIQNLPQNHIPDLALARELVKAGRYADIEALYESTPNVLSELIRTAFVPRPGCRFIVADFSASKRASLPGSRVSSGGWRCLRAAGTSTVPAPSKMFHVPVEKHGQNSHLRQKGKIAELALGYGGAVGALTAMGALEMGLAEEELPPLVRQWREANPHIIRLWAQVENAAMTAVREKARVRLGRLTFHCRSGMLFITLPSGRELCYVKPRIQTNRFGGDGLTYEGVGEAKSGRASRRSAASSRRTSCRRPPATCWPKPCCACATPASRSSMHVHDEAVLEVPSAIRALKKCARSWPKPRRGRTGFPCARTAMNADSIKRTEEENHEDQQIQPRGLS